MYVLSCSLRLAGLYIMAGIVLLVLTPGTAPSWGGDRTPSQLFLTPSGYVWRDVNGRIWTQYEHSSGSGSSITSPDSGAEQTWSLYATPSGTLVIPAPSMGEALYPALTVPKPATSLPE